ncbi:YbaK/EbsC family protein [Photobacterium sp. WH24]|uniref:YbaK/EbsC family protein n=1 Tax=Photobacterium sp. WH24 TaxID=2827237 RepID=UPI001C44BB05|nr:YbaK/EbsC family protein [Photobacterium sp. WH24]MBV7260420.1 YbaK/EbsC family protein [Photobacterium sp. WH24]
MNISTLYNNNVKLFETLNLDYRSYKHEPILDYETDLKVSKELGWTAAPSKSLFLKRKSGGYCVFVTHKENRFDQKKIRDVIGERVSICNNEEMETITGCIAGALCPFVLDTSIPIILDVSLLDHKEVMFTPADPSYTFIVESGSLVSVFESLNNEMYFYAN